MRSLRGAECADPDTPRRVLAFGEILWDRLPDAEVLGGAPLNFAYRSAALGDRTAIASRLGTDELGHRAWDSLRDFGIDTSLVQWDNQRATGTVDIEFDASRTAKIDVKPDAAYDFIEPASELLAAAEQADCICFGTVAQRNLCSRTTLNSVLDHGAKALKLLDINLRDNCYTRETACRAIERADIVKLNEDEAFLLSAMFELASPSIPQFASAMLRRWPAQAVVVTLAENGAFAASRSGDCVYMPGYCISMVDPLGAGDAFTAGFIHQYLRGQSLSQCCGYGNVLGALVACQAGATKPLRHDDIIGFLANPPPRHLDLRLRDLCAEEIK